jgi:hypothetical protein
MWWLDAPPPKSCGSRKQSLAPLFYFQFLVGLYLGTWILIETKYLQPKKRTTKARVRSLCACPIKFYITEDVLQAGSSHFVSPKHNCREQLQQLPEGPQPADWVHDRWLPGEWEIQLASGWSVFPEPAQRQLERCFQQQARETKLQVRDGTPMPLVPRCFHS